MSRYKVSVELGNGEKLLYSEDLAEFEVSEHYEDAKLAYPRDDVIIEIEEG